MKDLLRDLVETPGVTGDVKEIRETIRDHVEDYVDEIEVDDFGNLITRQGDGDTTLLVDAHMDQIGLTVQKIDSDGNLHFHRRGGVPEKSLYSQRVTVHGEDDIPGIIGVKPPHIGGDSDNLYVDIGAEDREEVEELGIEKGDTISYDRVLEELENQYVTAPAIDDRAGCAVAIEALKEFDEDYELVTVFSTQEEVGLKGAKVAAEYVDPDVALAIDVSIGDSGAQVEMGDGVDIILEEASGRGMILPEAVEDWLVGTAEDEDHDYQKSMIEGGRTDASKIQIASAGIPTGSIGIPTQYMHSPTEKVSLDDMEAVEEYTEDLYASFDDYF